MSSITSHLEQEDPLDQSPIECSVEFAAVGQGAKVCVPPLSATHSGLERMLWTRRSLEDLMAGRSYSIADGSSIGAGPKSADRLFFVFDPPFQPWDLPWLVGPQEIRYTNLVGHASKMACPSWDMPAGWMPLGGTCPASGMCQSIVPPDTRIAQEQALEANGVIVAPTGAFARPDNGHVDIRRSICQVCYAEGGQYASPRVAVGNMIRYWWTRQLLEGDRADYIEWVETVVRAIEGEDFEPECAIDPRHGKQVIAMRIHSSGDFFSPKYAAAWIDVCNQLPNLLFWAPTRTWAGAGWLEQWPRLLRELKHGNLILRPSALHTGDYSPGIDQHPWDGPYPYTAAGTTSIYKFDDQTPVEANGRSQDPRYDWGCQAYRAEGSAHDCRHAVAPDGSFGCRACWLTPELRINYTTH